MAENIDLSVPQSSGVPFLTIGFRNLAEILLTMKESYAIIILFGTCAPMRGVFLKTEEYAGVAQSVEQLIRNQ